MPHDKNGVELKCGDIVRILPPNGYLSHETIGSIQSVQKGNDMCNLGVEAIGKARHDENSEALPRVQYMTVTAKDCEKIA